MSFQELEREYLPTSVKSPEISILQTPKRVDMMPGLGRESRSNEETGFVLWLEVKRFYNDLNFALYSGQSLVEALNFAAKELEVNIRDYNVEFIKSKTVIPHLNRFGVAGGVQRIVGNNGRPVVDAISSQERNGSVLEAAKIVESFLLSAEPNSYAVTMSPSGWSGYELRHKNAQVMVSWKDQGEILRGLTLVADLSEAQARQVMIGLGIPEAVLTGENEQERLANIVRNPALLKSDTNPFEYVLDKILAIRGREDIKLLQKDGSLEQRSVEQIRADIKRLDELLIFDQEEESCIGELLEFIRGKVYQIGDENTQKAVVKEIEETVLKLAGEHLRKNYTSWKDMSTQTYLNRDNDDFRSEIAFLKSRGGCPTGALGGVSLGTESAAVMPSAITTTALKDKDFCIKCGACGEYIWSVVRRGQKCPKCPAIRQC
ncbi:hypothetical protein A3J19_03795 [Candidatus Daviesbacteria bacterium RIFCSPLOWO2_02_FULL_41_8]|uniref:Uncharacterized protein n=3 Tax=Candidatus Daviesiibacteriota TaxID=1752718 RepID=A0A1F5NL01_9BACT|nr:MAG: hypothetical protein A2871_04185 [Candidatus Daviesbacteria bacterium RIFCSPHIGHO2_01_FULL_41_23]OGE32388.1 MAG: hypothetical protein A3D83_01945 [Candidatus Daviesbacteria bacterium RIFCSPHIGHO2_02_FULL_41_10]OGE62261.1 MAG: hypothetical protein A2967_02285 [Candidatus Daviesbacteria bacterium RIFCSPLOWO2_01_FULL_41_32]OGE78359.1 MAG: hypothetical protein A3J19_03795 [Candidatus Daviesbacteria bacterium RIFCSPLOWO2_02_FULL_41_8]